MNGGRYIDIPIVDAAKRCGIRFNARTLGRTEVEAACPFCGDKPKRFHLSLNTAKGVYHCKLCGAGGNSVSLYARLHNVTNSEAARELLDGGNVYRFPSPPLQKPATEHGIKPLAGRHDVYYEMLCHLDLSERHRGELRSRGLHDGRISQNMYRTLPDDESARKFLADMLGGFYDLPGIPGFYTDKCGCWSVTGKGGLLIPVCDRDGYIQGLQVRLDDEGMEPGAGGNNRRYRWLSSRYKENGTKSSTWIHVTGDTSSKVAYLTEGPLKGDVASYLGNDALFICIAGINATEGLNETVKSFGVSEVLLAADMDKVTNPQVRDGFDRIAKKLSQIRGLSVRPINWNVCFKGIDDYYLIRHRALERGQDIGVKPGPLTDHLHRVWEKENPLQDAAFIDTCEWEEKVIHLSDLIANPPAGHLNANKVQHFKSLIKGGVEFPPLISVNNNVVDGFHRCKAYAESGAEQVRVYQNKPFVLHEAA